ncbi:hypothetical protein PBY51_017125 [Eleginops maclovinus]|uniref:GSK-3-binding protein n=1 Tax=Eleginops maclovinus TaxID=56733 RepID=A0AAN7XIQ6_ELEMC|nr:hypothetical protein PBY51_017125 [Eleginops maclovinus]
MPCRKENYIFLEQSVTVGSKEVDALVTKIGEALQLHNNSSQKQSVSCGGKPVGSTGAPAQKHSCCMRLRRGSSRVNPYNIPSQDWDQMKPWSRKRITVEEDDPHRLLQELLLSGNLIKEAVKRLQDCGDNVPS